MGLLNAVGMNIGMSLATRKFHSTVGQLGDDISSTWKDLTTSKSSKQKDEAQKSKLKKGKAAEAPAEAAAGAGYFSWLTSSSATAAPVEVAPVEPPKPTMHAGIVVIHVERIQHVSIANAEKRYVRLRFGTGGISFETKTEKIDAEGCAKFKSKRFTVDINEQTVNNTLLIQVVDKSGVVSHSAHVTIEQLTGGLNEQYYVLRDSLDQRTDGQILIRHIFLAADLKQNLVVEKQ